MDQAGPSWRGDEICWVYRPSNGIETCSPGIKIVEVKGRRPRYYAVEIVGKHFCGFDALAPPKGTAKVVWFGVGCVVEKFGQPLANNYTGMKTLVMAKLAKANIYGLRARGIEFDIRPPSKVRDHIRILIESHPSGTVVAIVSTHRCKTILGSIR